MKKAKTPQIPTVLPIFGSAQDDPEALKRAVRALSERVEQIPVFKAGEMIGHIVKEKPQ